MNGTHHILDLGLEPVGFEGEDYVVKLAIAPRHLNIGGIVHGGVFCSLLDTAMARSCFMADGNETLSAGTLEMKVNFLGAVREGTITARGRVVKTTRRTTYVEGTVTGEDGKLVARASATMIHFDS